MLIIKFLGINGVEWEYEFKTSTNGKTVSGFINRETNQTRFDDGDIGWPFSKGADRNVMLKWTKPELNQEAIIAYG
ncbi:MAG: hypothetical protein LBS41_00440 [Streptococcaceae bacterium]|jgi:hypothetical protein|nr:hypothetical protein [Streptococcaceae bacterium]